MQRVSFLSCHVFSAGFTTFVLKNRRGAENVSKTNGEWPSACQWPRAKIAETPSKHSDGFSVLLLDFW